MEIIRALKMRIYPNDEQKVKIDKTLGTCRFVYNHMLARNQKAYERRKEHLSYNEMQNLLPGMKNYLPQMKEADSQALKLRMTDRLQVCTRKCVNFAVFL